MPQNLDLKRSFFVCDVFSYFQAAKALSQTSTASTPSSPPTPHTPPLPPPQLWQCRASRDHVLGEMHLCRGRSCVLCDAFGACGVVWCGVAWCGAAWRGAYGRVKSTHSRNSPNPPRLLSCHSVPATAPPLCVTAAAAAATAAAGGAGLAWLMSCHSVPATAPTLFVYSLLLLLLLRVAQAWPGWRRWRSACGCAPRRSSTGTSSSAAAHRAAGSLMGTFQPR